MDMLGVMNQRVVSLHTRNGRNTAAKPMRLAETIADKFLAVVLYTFDILMPEIRIMIAAILRVFLNDTSFFFKFCIFSTF